MSIAGSDQVDFNFEIIYLYLRYNSLLDYFNPEAKAPNVPIPVHFMAELGFMKCIMNLI